MADDLSVVNAARVSFARRKDVMDESDEGLVRFLMRDRHGTPFEHNAFRFHIRCPIFVAREWFRHRIGCLTGDTRVTFVDANGRAGPRSTKTLEELWRLAGVLAGSDSGCVDEAANEFTTGRIASIVDKGVQPVYRIALADGKELTLTENHRLRPTGGWRLCAGQSAWWAPVQPQR